MGSVLKPLVLTVIFTLWVAYMPFLPVVVPPAVKMILTAIMGLGLIAYFITLLNTKGNWG